MLRRLRKGSTPLRALLLTAAAAIVLFWELMTPPVTGVADNGDFGKLLGRYGLGSGQDFNYAGTKYFFKDEYSYYSDFGSSELVLIAPAIAINGVISKDGSFDIRVMGAVHALLFLLGVYLLATALESAWVGVMALLLFCDFMYAGYFHSFYMDTAAYLFTLWSAVFYVRGMRRGRPADALGLLISMLLAMTAKPQYAMLGPWFAALVWMGRKVLWGGRKSVAAAAVAVLVGGTWFSYRFLAPERYRALAPFTVIFSQIVPNAPDPDGALRELGLDGSYRKWSGMNAFSKGTPFDDPAFWPEFVAHTSYGKIVRYYGQHPGEAWRALRASLDETGRFVSAAGNFDRGAGRAPAAQYHSFQVASAAKRFLFYHHGDFLVCYFAGLALGVTGMLVWNRKVLPEGAQGGGLALAGMATTTLGVSALADVYEQVRHQLVSLALFDMLLLVFLWLVIRYRPLRVPGLLMVALAACACSGIALRLHPVPPAAGELDDFNWRVFSYAVWSLVALALIWLILRPRKATLPAYYMLAGALCASAAGCLVFWPTPVTAGQYDDADHRVRFSGHWARDMQFGEAANHSITYSGLPGDRCRLTFRGSEIGWVHTKASNRGMGAVYVDGRLCGELDLYSPETVWQDRAVFSANGDGKHTFEVRILGRKNPQSSGTFVDVDALIVR